MRVENKGSILLLALLIMTSVMVASVGMSSLILGSLQQTRLLDNAAIAYYAAESGVEDALFTARRLDAKLDAQSSAMLGNGATWSRSVSTKETVLHVGTLPQDAVAEVALYDPDDVDAVLDISFVKVTWDDACTGASILRSTLIGWDATGWTPNAVMNQFVHSPDGALIAIPTSRLHRLRLIAKNCDLQNVVVTALKDTVGVLTAVDIPGRLKIVATGTYANVNQTLTATIPRRTPLSGLFDFVLFSECSLVKGSIGSCPTP